MYLLFEKLFRDRVTIDLEIEMIRLSICIVKIGLIGAGIWGQKILKELLALQATVVVIDKNSDCLSNISQGVDAMSSLKDVDYVDGWIVATPASTHRSVVESLDQMGNLSPIFCEKPLASSSEDAEWFFNRRGCPLFVMHIWTFHAGIRKLKELLLEGVIGELTMIRTNRMNWTSPRTDVDSLTNLAPHDLSIFQYFLGDLPKPIQASGEWIDGELVGCLGVLLGESGTHCVFEVSNRYGEKRREIRLHGTKGVLVLPDDCGQAIQLISGAGNLLPEKIKSFSFDSQSALTEEISSFLKYLKDRDSISLPSCEDGARVVIVIELVRKML